MGHSLGLELYGLGNMNRLLLHGMYIDYILQIDIYIHLHAVYVKMWDVFIGCCMCVCFYGM